MPRKLVAALLTGLLLAGCVKTTTLPKDTSSAPKASSASQALQDEGGVTLLLHIEFTEGEAQDVVIMDETNDAIIWIPRAFCESILDREVIRMIMLLKANNVVVTNIKGYCFNAEEYKDHEKSHLKPAGGRPSWIPNTPAREASYYNTGAVRG
tara:strand:- start:9686 stop:10144 length:459 start_codon:yes stop_codon:yes gene_type:complete